MKCCILQAEGIKQRDIAVSVRASRTSVQKCLRLARAAGIGWPLPEELDETALLARLYPSKARLATTAACRRLLP